MSRFEFEAKNQELKRMATGSNYINILPWEQHVRELNFDELKFKRMVTPLQAAEAESLLLEQNRRWEQHVRELTFDPGTAPGNEVGPNDARRAERHGSVWVVPTAATIQRRRNRAHAIAEQIEKDFIYARELEAELESAEAGIAVPAPFFCNLSGPWYDKNIFPAVLASAPTYPPATTQPHD
jgi:hypothetical protein